MEQLFFYFRLLPNRFMRKLLYGIDAKFTNILYLELLWHRTIGGWFSIKNPQTYNEKLQWLKLYYHNPDYTQLVDKVKVKDYVANKIGDEYVVKTIGVWNRAKEINFEDLPQQFVLKCNHDSGSVVIVKNRDSLDKNDTISHFDRCMKRNSYLPGREWVYKNVIPCVFAEELLEEDGCEDIKDYKLMCFDGKVFCIEYHQNRFHNHTQDFYSRDWELLDVSQGSDSSGKRVEKPAFVDKLIEFSELLSEGIPHVRVDWYYTKNKLYFGEFTFYDSSGFDAFSPHEFDVALGKMLNIPEKLL